MEFNFLIYLLPLEPRNYLFKVISDIMAHCYKIQFTSLVINFLH